MWMNNGPVGASRGILLDKTCVIRGWHYALRKDL
jgi:hypothetical protein